MRAVVTGGGGFIGSHLIESLLDRGVDVTCVERPGAPLNWIDGLPIRYVDHGINDPDRLAGSFRGSDVVFHLAGLTEARRPADFYRVNTEGTESVLKAAATGNGSAPHVILLSSLAAIGPCRNGENLSPDTVPMPLSHYGHSKLLAEVVVNAYSDRVPATILRLPSVYGPREKGVFKFFKLVQRGVALTVGSWDRELSMIYVKDVVQALLGASDRVDPVARTYCVAHPEPVTWRDFAQASARALRRSGPRLLSIPACVGRTVAITAELGARLRKRAAILNRERLREMMQERWVCDPSRAAEFGFVPEYPISRGIEESIAWYEEARWL